MALPAEGGDFFPAENMLYTGVGKLNAAYVLTQAIYTNKPNLIVNLGSAGSTSFPTGSVINCTRFIQRDMDVTPLGFPKYATPFDEREETPLTYGERLTNYEEGICGTGDSFHTSGATEDFNVMDMEAYVLAAICKRENIPFICLKFITDGANDDAAQAWEPALDDAAKALHQAYLSLNL